MLASTESSSPPRKRSLEKRGIQVGMLVPGALGICLLCWAEAGEAFKNLDEEELAGSWEGEK